MYTSGELLLLQFQKRSSYNIKQNRVFKLY